MKLILGAGMTRRDGWLTLDCDPERGADIVATIPPLPEVVTSQKWDEIEWIHGITSLYPWDAEQVLMEIREVLAMDGRLTLEQPDYSKVSNVAHVFGDPTFRNPHHMNKWAYTPATLAALLFTAGFSQVDVLQARYHRPERDFRIEACR